MAFVGFVNETSNATQWLTNGVLISENFVLTVSQAFSFFSYLKRTAKYVRLGDLDIASENDDIHARQYNVIESIAYPLYKNPHRYHDIALLKIEGRIEFNEYIRPACLTNTNTILSNQIIVSGRGRTSFRGRSESYMQKIAMNLVSHRNCNETYAPRGYRSLRRGIDNKTQICATTKFGERDACQVS